MPRKGESQQVTNALLSQKLEDLTKAVSEGFDGVHKRQDTTNGRIGTAEKDILLLQAAKWYERGLAGLLTVLVGIVVYFLTRGTT